MKKKKGVCKADLHHCLQLLREELSFVQDTLRLQLQSRYVYHHYCSTPGFRDYP